MNREELDLIESARPPSGAPTRAGWPALSKDRDLLLLTLSYFSINYVFYLFFNWFYYFLTEVRHVPAQLAGYFAGAQWILGAVAATAGGLLCDRLSATFGSSASSARTSFGRSRLSSFTCSLLKCLPW